MQQGLPRWVIPHDNRFLGTKSACHVQKCFYSPENCAFVRPLLTGADRLRAIMIRSEKQSVSVTLAGAAITVLGRPGVDMARITRPINAVAARLREISEGEGDLTCRWIRLTGRRRAMAWIFPLKILSSWLTSCDAAKGRSWLASTITRTFGTSFRDSILRLSISVTARRTSGKAEVSGELVIMNWVPATRGGLF